MKVVAGKRQVVEHTGPPRGALRIDMSICNKICQFTREPVSQFQIFDTFGMPSATVAYDHVDVVGRDIATADITVIIILSVERAYVG